MLVLSRKKGETIVIQDEIEVTILDVTSDTVKIGIKAPRHVEILRKEIHQQVQETNRESAAPTMDLTELQGFIKKAKKNS
ncbi:carbon storage regulator CsrA [Paenibacillus tarimensis]|uniref:carbon storage regulator CsrA n=1 Tax=Paenibacillus tarimensis TaxID=416012 RepID=UPI001F15B354|nr:carbon storage regulator CsrA [Paenibacillus tarimensis]MCF2944125.1 carbon storage regulator CsrA [Paenibacillus tarimensis]